jgi:DNA-binding transcriptional ArsR family regulator
MQVNTCISCDVIDVFDALSAPARRTILDELHDRNGQALYELCARLTMKHGLSLTRQAISQHLEVLEGAGLVKTLREGRYKFHFIDTAPLEVALARWRRNEHGGGTEHAYQRDEHSRGRSG